jgi:GDSL-like Lipase/Acylhydrolase family
MPRIGIRRALIKGTPITRERVRLTLRSACIVLLTTLATLAAIEVILRIVDLRILREGTSERSLTYRYDAELGWAPVPNSSSIVTTARTIHAQHNSLGFRDIEFARDARPTILFIGDSFVWGVDAEASERFTDLLRSRLPDTAIVNAGVSGYGTDQEYLLLQRIWATIQPSAVVLIFCTANDRLDNGTNIRYDGYQKPYFATAADGTLVLHGQPVPKSRQLYIKQDWLVRHLWLARLVAFAYVEIRHRQVYVPDPTERIISKMREFVEARGARLVVGLQYNDDKLVHHLQAERIPSVTFDGAETYSNLYGAHWTPDGHRLVAERLSWLLSENNIAQMDSVSR